MLRIDFAIENRSSRALWVFDVDPPYVCIAEDGRVLLASAYYPIPPGLSPYRSEQPPVAELDAGATVRRSYELALPLTVAAPYILRDPSRLPIERRSAELSIAIGWLERSDDIASANVYFRGAFVPSINVPISAQRVAFSAPMAVDVPIVVRFPAAVPYRRTEEPSPLAIALDARAIGESSA